MKQQKTFKKAGLITVALFLIFSSTAFGVTGIGAGGIPGLILTTDMLTNFSDFSAAYLNPALLTGIDQGEATIGTRMWGIVLSPWYVSAAVPLGLDHTAALSALSIGLSNVEQTNKRGEKLPGQYISAAENIIQGSYAYKILPFLSLGSNATVIIPNVAEEGELGVTFDLGMRFHPIEDYLLGKTSLGLNVQNVFYKDFGRSFGDEFNKYPLNIHLQFHWFNEYYRTFLERFELSFNCAIMDLITEANNFGNPENTVSIDNLAGSGEAALKEAGNKFKNISVVYGAHAKWFPFKFFGIRSGINTNGVVPFGVSLNWKHINILKRVQLDYDFGISIEDSLPQNSKSSHLIRFVVRFGPTREEAVSERWYRELAVAPQRDFNEAMRLYLAKKYWLASFAFGKVLAKWPAFSKVDIATFYMGKSYEYMHMHDVARETYNKGIKKYTTSDFRPKFIFQLQNLAYKNNDFDDALKHYGFIMNLYRESDVAPDADYVAGQIYYNKKEFESAINVLTSVEPGNENYLYAQYTLAMINVHRKNFDDALEHLNNIVNIDTVKTISEKSLREMAYVKLGHIFFEQGELKFSYGAYKQVPPGSRFYDEALLGLSWTMVRGGVEQSYTQAVQTADRLISARPKSNLLAEAHLVMGYAFTLLKQYSKAVDAYKNVIRLCDAKYISRDEYKVRKSENQTKMKRFNDFQKEVIGIALRKPTPALNAKKETMTGEWENFDAEIQDFAAYQIEANKQFSFKKSAIKLKKDAEYALATTLHLIENQKKVRIMEDTKDKTRELDSEMDKLQKELQELEEKE